MASSKDSLDVKSLSTATERMVSEIFNELSNMNEVSTCVSAVKYFSLDGNITDRSHNDAAERWLHWAGQVKDLKVVTTDVPSGILPEGVEGQMIDIKVFCRRGPDDKIYDKNKNIRQKVARGNSFLTLSGKINKTSCILQALKKFTGGFGDDDDRETGNNLTWKKYFTKPIEEAAVIIATKKANGEAAHLSCIEVEGEYILCGGSKNVHLLFRNKDDIKKYVEPRYLIAREICETVLDGIEKGGIKKDLLLKFLACTGLTAVFEILSPAHQHVEDLSHLKSPVLEFITWTKVDLDPKEHDLAVIPPHLGIEVARHLGLTTVNYDVITYTELSDRIQQIREGYQYEGEVLYFLDQDHVVIGLLKKKTIWYIFCRAVREKLRNACSVMAKKPSDFNMSKLLQKMTKRAKEIQMWLGFSNDVLVFWEQLTEKFLKWAVHKFQAGEVPFGQVADQFPSLWKTFLNDVDENDDIRKVPGDHTIHEEGQMTGDASGQQEDSPDDDDDGDVATVTSQVDTMGIAGDG